METKSIKLKLGALEGIGLLNLYMLPELNQGVDIASLNNYKVSTTSYLCHIRSGHIGHRGLDVVVKNYYGNGIGMSTNSTAGAL